MTTAFFARAVPLALASALLLAFFVAPGSAWAQEPPQPVTITIEVALPAEAHNTPRDWYFEVTDTTGAVADAVTVSTTALSPAGSATRTLPPGNYRVNYLFSDQVAQSCGDTTFFALAGPVNATASVTADGSLMHIRYEFEACPAASQPVGSVVQASTTAPVEPSTSTAPKSSSSSSDASAAEAAPRFAAAPLPPDTGTGLADAEADAIGALPVGIPLAVVALIAAAALRGGSLRRS